MYSTDDIEASLAMKRDRLVARADEIREQFAEQVDRDTIAEVGGWAMVGTGVVWGAVNLLQGRRGVSGILGPILALLLGASVLGGRSVLSSRSELIDEARFRIDQELDALDPIARWQVLRSAAQEHMPFVHAHNA